MKAKALETWQGCLIEGKIYDVIAKNGYLILIKEESGRFVWSCESIFELIIEPNVLLKEIKVKINWEVI